MLIFLLTLIIILIFPIRLKFSAYFVDNLFEIYFYKFKLYPRKIKETKDSSEANTKETLNNKFSKKEKNNKKFKFNIKKIIYSLLNNKIKPRLKLKIFMDYSLSDAALTAQMFGIINMFIYSSFEILNLFIKINSPKLSITPLFDSNISINAKIDSILYINLAQIIYIAFLISKNIEKKGGVPLRETYGE